MKTLCDIAWSNMYTFCDHATFESLHIMYGGAVLDLQLFQCFVVLHMRSMPRKALFVDRYALFLLEYLLEYLDSVCLLALDGSRRVVDVLHFDTNHIALWLWHRFRLSCSVRLTMTVDPLQ